MAKKSELQNQTSCINFEECPLCYKCRGFKSASNKCLKCTIEVCDRPTHIPKNINMMVSRPVVEFNKPVTFKSYTKE